MKLRNKPWINDELQKMIRIKDRLLKKYKRNDDQPAMDLFKKFRNLIAIALKDSKANYYYNYFQTNGKNMKQLWSGIKSVINIRNYYNVIRKMKNPNDALASDPVVIGNLSNKFFVNVSYDIAKKIPRTRTSPLGFIQNRICDSVFIALQLLQRYLILSVF